MAGGGTAQAMKVSDVFIVVGISILVAGFIMHAWVSSEQYDFEGGDEEVIEKSFVLFKGDKLEVEISIPTDHLLEVYVYTATDSELTKLEPIDESISDLFIISSYNYQFTADSNGEYLMYIDFVPINGNESISQGEIFVDVQRNFLIDFLPYPIGAISLAFGIHKRKEEKSTDAIDAELD